jgi:glycosyltransferase involved in cell wall biosynthesis
VRRCFDEAEVVSGDLGGGREAVRAAGARIVAPVNAVLSVVVPVYNGGPAIVGNIEAIRAAIVESLGDEQLELIVVSDGSIDGTAERLLAERIDGVRVLHYDRNLGKGYAVKAGILASHGSWVGLCDADLDLDPAALPGYLRVAQREGLDLAVGSKRHPESVVHYPRSRRVGSWGYQQLNRLLFGLEVRDTQVGLKVMSRSVADEVVPLLLVKQFAFDLELLAVAHALGFTRIKEMPIRLDYRFTGSGVRSAAVARALLDTAAVFYRLRILRTYHRKRRLLPLRHERYRPLVSLVAMAPEPVQRMDYQPIEEVDDLATATGELTAIVAPGARAAGSFVSAAVPYFADPAVAAVVCPVMAPLEGSFRQRLGAAVLESRLGGGSRRVRHMPGNLRVVRDYPTGTFVARTSALVDAAAAGVGHQQLVAWLAEERLLSTVYTPETMVVQAAPPAILPLVQASLRHGRGRGRAARRTRGRSMSIRTGASLAPAVLALTSLPLLLVGGTAREVALGALALYGSLILTSSLLAGARFRSLRLGVAVAPLLAASQIAYAAGFLEACVGRASRAPSTV